MEFCLIKYSSVPCDCLFRFDKKWWSKVNNSISLDVKNNTQRYISYDSPVFVLFDDIKMLPHIKIYNKVNINKK